MNILIVGKKNYIGSTLFNQFKKDNNVYYIEEDTEIIFNKARLYSIAKTTNSELVIDLFEENDYEKCEIEPKVAYRDNSISAVNLAYVCKSLHIPLVYLSSYSVYGETKDSPYFETDECNPINNYGKSKLAGEKLIQNVCTKYFIIRCGWILGKNNEFMKKILKNIHSDLFMCSSEIGSPTCIEDIYATISKIIETDYYGIYNCANPDPIKKSILVERIFSYLNIKKNIVEIPSNYLSNFARRPEYSVLDTALINNCLEINYPNWQERLESMLSTVGIE